MHSPRVRGTSALAALVLLASACAGPHSSTTRPASQDPTSASTVKSGLADVLVQVNCEAKPASVQRLIGGADATLKTEPLGTRCVWGKLDADTRIELVAVRPVNYAARQAHWPGPKTNITVPGATQAVVLDDPGQTADGKVKFCAVVAEVDARALEILGFGFSAKGCPAMVEVAAEMLKAQVPQSRTLPPAPASTQR